LSVLLHGLSEQA